MNTAQTLPIVDAASIERPPARGARVRRPVRAGGASGLLSVIDTLVAMTILGVVFVALTGDVLPHGLDAVLAIHVTLKVLLGIVLVVLAWTAVFRAFGVSVTPLGGRTDVESWRVFVACGACAAVAELFLAVNGAGMDIAQRVIFWWAGSMALLATHLGSRAWTQRRRTAGRRQRVLVVGTGPLTLRVLDALSSHPEMSYDVAGFVDTPKIEPASPAIARLTVGTLDSLESILMRDAIDEVFVALPVKSHYREIQNVISTCERIGVSAKYRTDIFQADVAWPRTEGDVDHVVTMRVTDDDYRVVVKRFFDVFVAGVLLALLAPVVAIIAAAVTLTSPGGALYGQERYGFNRRRFRMLKFRTMVAGAEAQQADLESLNEADGPVFKIAKDPRVTAIGRILRRTSLDELPQLINVLSGEMSLVGPRPLPLRDVERFTHPGDMRRFSVRPGLTCLWQVSGRSNLSFAEWMQLDLRYIDRWSLGLDLLILVRTVPAVFRGTGAH